MYKYVFLILLFFCLLFVISCASKSEKISAFPPLLEYHKNGKLITDSILPYIYTRTDVDELNLKSQSKDFLLYIRRQKKLLEIDKRSKKRYRFKNLSISKDKLILTTEAIENWIYSAFVPPSEYLDAYQIQGKDQKGNILYTGYYSPVIPVSRTPTAEFIFPIYKRPQDMTVLPTREQIYKENALAGKGLELAYARSLIDIQKMQLQGSGFVQYRDGVIQLFSYGGDNGQPRRSIQRYFLKKYGKKGQGITLDKLKKYVAEHPENADDIIFHNPSNVFFIATPKGKVVIGSGNVPLKEHLSIATDNRYIPTGSCLYAEKPIPLKNNTRHERTFLLAQDVGGGIKGTGRFDVYTGIGKKAKKEAELMHYGRAWLLLVKDRS